MASFTVAPTTPGLAFHVLGHKEQDKVKNKPKTNRGHGGTGVEGDCRDFEVSHCHAKKVNFMLRGSYYPVLIFFLWCEASI